MSGVLEADLESEGSVELAVQVGLTLASIMSNGCGSIYVFRFGNYYAILDTMTYWQKSLIEMKIKRLVS